LLEFHAPRELYSNTRNLNVGLLYDTKIGLVPQGAVISDLQRVYLGMIPPLLHMERTSLANQAMGMLSQLDRREPGALELAIARINLAANNPGSADIQLKKARESMPPHSPLLADREELWGQVAENRGDTEEAIQHYEAAFAADPRRPTPPRRLAELNGQNKNWKEAARWMETYTKVEPAATGHELALLGDYFMADMDLDRAVPAFENALKKDEYTFFAKLNLARIFEVQNRVDDAIEQYEWMMHYAFDRDSDIYVKLVKLYKTKGGKEREIRAVLKKGHRIYPTDIPIYRLYREAFGAD
jgi:tetratricopeptide (TPR) repeat protein